MLWRAGPSGPRESQAAAMCTLVVVHRGHPSFPVIVAANRDEFYARTTAPPAVLAEGPRVVGGRDMEKGGTWLAVNAHGMFVGLTNQRTWYPADASRRSRGEVVLAALACTSSDTMAHVVRRTDASLYNPFNLLFGDAHAMYVAYFRHGPPSVTVEPLPQGLHVLPNDVLDSPEFPKVARATALIAPALAGPFEDLALAMKSALRDHERARIEHLPPPPADAQFPPDMVRELSSLCVHTAVYGTRSASFVALAPGRVAHFEFAAGRPCENAFVDVRGLLG